MNEIECRYFWDNPIILTDVILDKLKSGEIKNPFDTTAIDNWLKGFRPEIK